MLPGYLALLSYLFLSSDPVEARRSEKVRPDKAVSKNVHLIDGEDIRSELPKRIRFHGAIDPELQKRYKAAMEGLFVKLPPTLLEIIAENQLISFIKAYGYKYTQTIPMDEMHRYGPYFTGTKGEGVVVIYLENFEPIMSKSAHYFSQGSLEVQLERLVLHQLGHHIYERYLDVAKSFLAIRADKTLTSFGKSFIKQVNPDEKVSVAYFGSYDDLFKRLKFPERFDGDVYAVKDEQEYFANSLELYFFDRDRLIASLSEEEITWLRRIAQGEFLRPVGRKPIHNFLDMKFDYQKLRKLPKEKLIDSLLERIRFIGPVTKKDRAFYPKYMRQLFARTSKDFLLSIYDFGVFSFYSECPENPISKITGQCDQMHIYPEAFTMVIVLKDLMSYLQEGLGYGDESRMIRIFQVAVFHEFCHYILFKYPDSINKFLNIRALTILHDYYVDLGMMNKEGMFINFIYPSKATRWHYCLKYNFPLRSDKDHCYSATDRDEYWAVSAEMYFFQRRRLKQYLSAEEMVWLDKFSKIIGNPLK